jgi:mRNA-degrading endonuclease toxin of MazEF toxin-antitoxin module
VLTWVVGAPSPAPDAASRHRWRWGLGEGLRVPGAASFDNIQPIRRSFLTERIGTLRTERRLELCRALAALADC